MLLALWSPKGGSGVSVVAAACAIVAAREAAGSAGVRLVDLDGDQPAVFGLGSDPELGVVDWMRAGPEAPSDALDRMLVEVAPGLGLLPRGAAGRVLEPVPAAEAGAALAVLLGDGPGLAVADCGTGREPATRAVAEVASVAVVVLRGCYLALRRAVASPLLGRTVGVVLLEEPGRSLNARPVTEVLGVPVLARVPVREATARAVDAGVLATRLPESLARAAGLVLVRTGVARARGAAA